MTDFRITNFTNNLTYWFYYHRMYFRKSSMNIYFPDGKLGAFISKNIEIISATVKHNHYRVSEINQFIKVNFRQLVFVQRRYKWNLL